MIILLIAAVALTPFQAEANYAYAAGRCSAKIDFPTLLKIEKRIGNNSNVKHYYELGKKEQTNDVGRYECLVILNNAAKDIIGGKN